MTCRLSLSFLVKPNHFTSPLPLPDGWFQ